MFYDIYIKRGLDFFFSLVLSILLGPLMLLISLMVRVLLGSPVIFKQQRPGKNGKIFLLFKFRTMTDKKDEKGQLLPDEFRLTKFGKLLRSTSLDELPELWNILKGEMSFVGPRPLLVQYLPLYNTHQKKRHNVRPGLTGLAQVKGRNSISWEERFKWDVNYVKHQSFLLDFRIIIMTIRAVFCKEGISSGTSATMEDFKGTNNE